MDLPHDLLPGVLVGHETDPRPTGVTVVLLPDGTTVGVDVRGAAPGTRETDLLDPVNTIDVAHAIVLSGGSAYGLATATGVMRWLEEQGRGVEIGPVRVPIVPAAVVFDLLVGDPGIRPDAEAGYRACAAAVPIDSAEQGSVGAGAGATVGKLLGPERAMRGGLGVATLTAGGVTMAAVVVVNAVGDVVDPRSGAVLAGARTSADALDPAGTVATVLTRAQTGGQPPEPGPGGATTIGALVTDARLTKAQATRLAQVAHDGLARTIRPVHTPMDGDTLFMAGTGTGPDATPSGMPGAGMTLLSIMAAEVTAQAVVAGIRSAAGVRLGDLWLPAWRDRPTAAGTGIAGGITPGRTSPVAR
jgi:L-aminopeptidase/D-esterase-like protein